MKLLKKKDPAKSPGHYSPAVIHDNIVYVSGQLPIDPVTGEGPTGTVKEQVKKALGNLESVLQEAGSCKENVLRATVYVPDVSLWADVNEAYAEFFGDHMPARTVVPSGPLFNGSLVEVEAIAFIK